MCIYYIYLTLLPHHRKNHYDTMMWYIIHTPLRLILLSCFSFFCWISPWAWNFRPQGSAPRDVRGAPRAPPKWGLSLMPAHACSLVWRGTQYIIIYITIYICIYMHVFLACVLRVLAASLFLIWKVPDTHTHTCVVLCVAFFVFFLVLQRSFTCPQHTRVISLRFFLASLESLAKTAKMPR